MKNTFRAFTLIEVTLALALAAFAVTAILGLLPTAFRSLQQTVDVNAGNRITGGISGEALQSNFSERSGFLQTFPRYYDRDGFQILKSDGAIYRADLGLLDAEGVTRSSAESWPVHSSPLLISAQQAVVYRINLVKLTGTFSLVHSIILSDNGR